MDYFDEQFFPLFNSTPRFTGFTANYPTYYGIQYNHAGPLYLRVDHQQEYTVTGANVFITHPGAFFEYGNVNHIPRHHCFICSYGPRIAGYIEGGLLEINSNPPLTAIANPDRFLLTMLEIMALLRQRPVPPARAVLLYEDLLLQIQESRQQEKHLPPFQQRPLEDLIEIIRKTPELEFDFAREAARLHITETHFRRLFRRLCGMSPVQYHLHCRMEKAARLLLTGAEQVVNVAEAVGISNRYYFSKLFKNQYHLSPLAYRREFQGSISAPLAAGRS